MLIESSQNPRYKVWKKLLTKKGRSQHQLFMVEGFHLAEEALRAHWPLEAIIVAEQTDLTPIKQAINAEHLKMTYTVPAKLFTEISETQSPQGIILVLRKIVQQSMEQLSKQANLLLLIDEVQDPGNLGTIIRTADAAGVDGIILGRGTVDAYSGKTLRSTQGSIFHLPLLEENLVNCIEHLRHESWMILGTSLSGAEDYRVTSIDTGQKLALIVGNEGKGIADPILQLTDRRIKIPIWGRAESLNVGVATGILLYHLRNQLRL